MAPVSPEPRLLRKPLHPRAHPPAQKEARQTKGPGGAYWELRVLGPDPQRLGRVSCILDGHARPRAKPHSATIQALREVGHAPAGIPGLHRDLGHGVLGVISLLALGVWETTVTSWSLSCMFCSCGPEQGLVWAPTLTTRRKVLALGMLLVMVRFPESALMENVLSSFPERMECLGGVPSGGLRSAHVGMGSGCSLEREVGSCCPLTSDDAVLDGLVDAPVPIHGVDGPRVQDEGAWLWEQGGVRTPWGWRCGHCLAFLRPSRRLGSLPVGSQGHSPVAQHDSPLQLLGSGANESVCPEALDQSEHACLSQEAAFKDGRAHLVAMPGPAAPQLLCGPRASPASSPNSLPTCWAPGGCLAVP